MMVKLVSGRGPNLVLDEEELEQKRGAYDFLLEKSSNLNLPEN